MLAQQAAGRGIESLLVRLFGAGMPCDYYWVKSGGGWEGAVQSVTMYHLVAGLIGQAETQGSILSEKGSNVTNVGPIIFVNCAQKASEEIS